jgi:hypothetical protein
MGAKSPDVLMDSTTEDLPAYSRMVSGMAVIAQRVRIRLTTLLGNWPLDRAAGIDWIGILGSKPFDAEAAAATVVLEMVDTPGVTGAANLDFDQDGDVFRMSCSLATEYGQDIPVVIEAPGIDGNLSIVVGGVVGHSGRVTGE